MSGWETLGGGDFEVLSSDDGEADQDGPSRWPGTRGRIVIGAAAASVLAVAGGAYVAYGALSGGGAQPETVVPATAAAYAEVDLDPAASQKVAAFRFLHRFPQLAKQLKGQGSLGPDLVASGFEDSDDVQFTRDIKPWLGSRAAVAVVPDLGGHPTYEIAVQVRDEAAARRLLPGLMAKDQKANAESDNADDFSSCESTGVSIVPSAGASSEDTSNTVTGKDVCTTGSDDDAVEGDLARDDADPSAVLDRAPEGWVIQGGYVILAPTQADAKALARAATTGTLADNPTYREDLRPLGAHIASVWVDPVRLKPLAGKNGFDDGFLPLSDLIGGTGRTALVLRFTGSAAEVIGRMKTPHASGSPIVSQLGKLPENTMVGLEVTRAGDQATGVWDAYSKFVDSFADAFADESSESGDSDGAAADSDDPQDAAAVFKKDYGVDMPQDLLSLVGTDFMFAVGGADGHTHYAIRASMPAAAATHLASVSPKMFKPLDLPAATTTSSGLAWSDNTAYGATIGKGNLGSSDGFRAAVPDIEHASWALYVNWAQVSAATHAKDDDVMDHLGTLGITLSPDGNSTKVTARLTGR